MTKLGLFPCFILLLSCYGSSAKYVEPSQRAKEKYRDTQDENSLRRWIPFRSKSGNQGLQRPRFNGRTLLEELESMMYLYAFATVRETIREGGIQQSRWMPWSQRRQLENYEIIEENDKDDGNPGCLKKPLTGKDLEKVLTPSNMEHLANDAELANALNYRALLAMKMLGKKGILWEFDDRIGDSRLLVFAITINQAAKRVTIVFRGSVNLQDWVTNLTMRPRKLDIPVCLQGVDLGFDNQKEPIALHSGFCDYLDPSFNHILECLKVIYKKYPKYKLFVTGHSLGGALATLLAYRLAGSTEDEEAGLEIPLPIVCITYAAPMLGNTSFQKAFHGLEKLGSLQHIRVTNQFDVVPRSPPGYVQTGINLHLMGKGAYEVADSNVESRSFGSQFHLFCSPAAHSIISYWQEGQLAQDKLRQQRSRKVDSLRVRDLYNRLPQ